MTRRTPLLALVGVTAIWGVTFVQVQDAIALYPLFAFLAVRFAISTAVLAPFAWRSLRTLPRSGYVAGVGVGALLATAYGLQTAGLELTTVASTGFITGLYVVFTPLLALVFFGTPVPRVSLGGRRARCCRAALAERRSGRVDAGQRPRAGERRLPGPPDHCDGTLRPALRPACADVSHDGDVVRRLHRDRARARRARGAARRDGVGSASRHRGVRRGARLPHRDVGPGADDSCAGSARVHPRSAVRRAWPAFCSRARCSGGSGGSGAS